MIIISRTPSPYQVQIGQGLSSYNVRVGQITTEGGSCNVAKDARTDDIGAASNSTNIYIANKFTAASSYSLCKATVTLYRHASQNQDYAMEIRTDGTSQPSETILGTSETVPVASVGTTRTTVEFVFSSPVSISSGTSYWLVIKYVSASSYTTFWAMGNGAPEHIVRSTTGLTDSWTNVETTRQAVFTTYASS